MDNYKKPDDVLTEIGKTNVRIMLAIFSCALMWVVGSMQLMTSAFTTVKCDNCSFMTINEEFDLEGENAYLVKWTTSSFMAGNMIGGASLTYAADYFGRRPVLLLCVALEAILAVAASWSPNIYVFAALRFLHGVVYIAAAMVAWVTAYEHSPTTLRSFTTLIFGLSWVLGYCCVAPIAIAASSWREIIRNCAIPMALLFIIHYCFIPETLHFLVRQNKKEEAKKWLENIDCKRVVDIDLLFNKPDFEKQESTFSKLLYFLKHKKFILFAIIQVYLWICDVFIYFGVSLHSTQLAGNMYVNYILMGIVEIPAYILTPKALDWMGRRRFVAVTHFIAAVSFVSNLFYSGQTFTLCCWLIGKWCISCSFMALFVFASELFPTSIRNISVGMCSVLSRVGGIAAPHISLLALISPFLPPIVLSSMSALAGFLTLCLPETRDKPLPVDIEE